MGLMAAKAAPRFSAERKCHTVVCVDFLIMYFHLMTHKTAVNICLIYGTTQTILNNYCSLTFNYYMFCVKKATVLGQTSPELH